MSKVTPKQESFALAYLRLKNASDAYREAYAPKNMAAKTVNEAACRLLKNSKIVARLAELTAPAAKAAGLSVERTLAEVARCAYSDVRKLYRPDGSLKAPDEWDDDTAAAVAGTEISEIRVEDTVIGHTKKLKLWDKNTALEKAMKHFGLYERDNAQTGKPVLIKMVFE